MSAARSLGLLILKYRDVNGISQTDVGKQFQPKLTHVSIGRWEKGKQFPSEKHFKKLAEIISLQLSPNATAENQVSYLCQLLERSPEYVESTGDILITKSFFQPNKHHLTVLYKGREAWNKWREKNSDVVPELSGLNLTDFVLDGIDLSKADLRMAVLSKGSLEKSSFENADMRGASLEEVCFDRSCFDNADLEESELNRCSLKKTCMVETYLIASKIKNCQFNCSCLYKSHFAGARIDSSDFSHAILNQTYWDYTHMDNTQIYGASFVDAEYLDTINTYSMNEWTAFSSRNAVESVGVKSLSYAPLIHLDRYYRPVLEQYIQDRDVEKEAILLAQSLLEKYGEWQSQDNSQIFIGSTADKEYAKDNGGKLQLRYIIEEKDNHFTVRLNLPDKAPDSIWNSDNFQRYLRKDKVIIEIENEFIKSNLTIEELKDLQGVYDLRTEKQKETIYRLLPIAHNFFEISYQNSYRDRQYKILKDEDNFILQQASNAGNILMYVNYKESVLTIKRSVLNNKHILDFARVLERLKMRRY